MFLANSELSSSGVKFRARIVFLSNWNISRVGIVSMEDYLVNELTAFTWKKIFQKDENVIETPFQNEPPKST